MIAKIARQVGLNETKPNKNMFTLNLLMLGILDITEKLMRQDR
jgi:hypothetical protein